MRADVFPYQAVYVPGHIWLPRLVDKRQLTTFESLQIKLPEKMQRDYNTSDIITSAATVTHFINQTYLIPLFSDGHLMFYNKKYNNLLDSVTVSPLMLDTLASSKHLPTGVDALAL